MADPVAEEAPAETPMPDNIVNLQRIRESYRFKFLSFSRDLSCRPSPEEPGPFPQSAGAAPDVPAAQAPAPGIPADSPPNREIEVLDGVFQWTDPDSPKRSPLLPAIRFLLLFTAIGTAFACLGYLVQHLAK